MSSIAATDMNRARSVRETSESLFGNYFVSAYPPFSCWSRSELEIFRQRLKQPHLSNTGSPFGLYVHIPFCEKRCDYCYYLSFAGKTTLEMEGYLKALTKELALYSRKPALTDRKLTFVYFGGGTPSLLPTARIRRLMQDLKRSFSWDRVQEVTFECAPRSTTPEKLEALRAGGVTRLSLGVQQFDDDVLQRNGRVHMVCDIERAYAAIRRIGFPVVNIDLIVGMMGETDESFERSVDRTIELEPESVTIYQLEIPYNTPLYRDLRHRCPEGTPIKWKIKRQRLDRAFAQLEEAGYSLASAYAALRDPQRYRFVYQEDQYRGADLLGIGVASFSYLRGIHQQNVASFDAYLARLQENRLPLGRAYALDTEERLVREFVLQLKLGGCRSQDFRAKFGVDIHQRFSEPLAEFADKGWLTSDQEEVRLTRAGMLRVDHMIPSFYLPEHGGARYS